MLAGWLSVSLGNIEASVKTWDGFAAEESEVEDEVDVCPWTSLSREVSPSTKKRESMFDFGSASGASVSNNILSEET